MRSNPAWRSSCAQTMTLGLSEFRTDRERRAAVGEARRRRDLALPVRFREAAAHAHHFARRAHFRPEDRVDALELREREDGFP